RDPLAYDAEGVQQHEGRLDAGNAGADLREVVGALPLGQREPAMIAPDAVDQAALEAAPECSLRSPVAKRWCHQVAGGVRPRVERVIENQIMRTRLRQGGHAEITSLRDQVDRHRG